MQIIEAKAVHRGIRGRGVEVRGVHLRDLAPGRQFGRRHVLPVLATVARHVNQAIVGTGPDQVCVFRRRSNRIDHAAMLAFQRISLDKRPQSRWRTRIFARQVGADNLPTVATVAGCEQDIRSEI